MFFKKGKFWLGLLLALILGVLAAVGAWYWLTTGHLTSAKLKIYSLLPFPAATVNGQPVSIKDFSNRLNLASAYAQKNRTASYEALTAPILQELVIEKSQEILAAQKNILPSQSQLDAEYSWQKQSFEASGNKNFEKALNDYGFSPNSYRDQILKAQTVKINLQKWFYQQKDLNAGAYSKANEILDKLKTGAPFQNLAQTQSQDQPSQIFGGDMGFKNPSAILPELLEQIKNLQPKQPLLAVTRNGLEIVMLADTSAQTQSGDAQIHLLHIYIKGGDFQTWLDNQTQNYKIKQIIKL